MNSASAQEIDPHLRFQTIRTAHFRLHFHESARDIVLALAPIVEQTWLRFADRGTRPPALTDVVITDQSDAANGYASPLPRNRIVLYTAAPTPGLHLNPVAWLEVLFVHEFTHIVHLDRARGWAAAGRHVFGRAPWLFPNLFLPTWQIEGLATLEESRMPGRQNAGRLHSGAFGAITGEAARSRRVPPLDRINGGVSDWPAGLAPYAWGADFHAFLEDRYGQEALDQLAAGTSGSLPWLGSLTFRGVLGESLGSLWRDYAETREGAAETRTLGVRSEPRRLTHHGHLVGAARFAPPACAACAPSLVYSVASPDHRPAIYRMTPGEPGAERLATRYGGSTLAVDHRGTIYFDQSEIERNAGSYNDLYALGIEGGPARRLTTEVRLLDPDISADGARIVAVKQAHPFSRELVVAHAGGATIDTIASGEGVVFSTPRWSPDGASIVAIRQVHQGQAELVVVDAASGVVGVVAAAPEWQWAMPTWHPGGERIVASLSVDGEAFNLAEIEIGTGSMRWLTDLPSGALWPTVAADERTIVFTGYTVEGYDLFAIDYPRAGAPVAAPSVDSPSRTALAQQSVELDNVAVADYRPWPTLLPTSWTPVLELSDRQVRVGALTTGRDVLGYHNWSVGLSWQVSSEVENDTRRATPDWSTGYIYQRWQLQPFVSAWRQTDDVLVRFEGTHTTARVASIERGWEAGLAWPFVRNRRVNLLQVSVAGTNERWVVGEFTGSRDRSALRGVWRYASAIRPGYAISPERGIRAGIGTEFVSPALGASAAGGAAAFDLRAYLPGAARHDVVAVRAVGATTWGDAPARRAFALGGGEAAPLPGTLSSDAAAMLRGFSPTAFVGRHVSAINIDYRFPIARPQRGIGTWPVLLHSIHGAAVADVGHAWTDAFRKDNIKTSLGGEVSADVVLGYAMRLTVTGGIAWGHDAAVSTRWSPTAYARVGHAF